MENEQGLHHCRRQEMEDGDNEEKKAGNDADTSSPGSLAASRASHPPHLLPLKQ